MGDAVRDASRGECSRARVTGASHGDRPRVRIAGTVQVTRHDRIGGVPAFAAELRDDGARVDLVWLGRARISGVEPGSTVVAEGRLAVRRGRATMFNPRYELGTAGLRASQFCTAS